MPRPNPNALRRTPVPREAQLVDEYRPLALHIARDFYAPGLEADDVRQHALIGVLGAVRTWKPAKGDLKPHVVRCVKRELFTMLTAAHRFKHGPLNESFRFVINDDGETEDATVFVPDEKTEPHRHLVAHTELREAVQCIRGMTRLEQQAVVGVAVGMTYAELQEVTGRGFKTIDNALQRGRLKLHQSRLRCVFCGDPTAGRACYAHSDLLELDRPRMAA